MQKEKETTRIAKGRRVFL